MLLFQMGASPRCGSSSCLRFEILRRGPATLPRNAATTTAPIGWRWHAPMSFFFGFSVGLRLVNEVSQCFPFHTYQVIGLSLGININDVLASNSQTRRTVI